MKTVNSELLEALNYATNFLYADLFDLVLIGGYQYCIAKFDKDITYGGKIYYHSKSFMERSYTELSGTPSVDTVTVTINATPDDKINGVALLKAAHDGMLDGATINMRRAYFDPVTESLIGVVNVFVGEVEVSQCAGMTCTLNCKSECTGLAALLPLRIFAPQNVYARDNTGKVVSSSTDNFTCMIPLKPSQNVLVRL